MVVGKETERYGTPRQTGIQLGNGIRLRLILLLLFCPGAGDLLAEVAGVLSIEGLAHGLLKCPVVGIPNEHASPGYRL